MRFNVAIISEQVFRHTSAEQARAQLQPMLEALAGDTDRDVKFYAEKSLTAIRAT